MAAGWHPWPVSLSDDLPPASRSLFFPVVIATVLLIIIGMSGGISLAWYHNARKTDNPGQSSGTPTGVPYSEDPSAVPSGSGKPCRPETQQVAPSYGAEGTLRIRLLLRTKDSAVWICADETGNLWYQANRGGEHATWIEGQTALFLPGVQSDGQGGYVVTARDGTVFSITAQRLRILHKDGTIEVQNAVP
ncbi:MAG: hypothetical protein QOC94_1602 [Actinoplanes sp.]|jgi:hypothetical protein|nr:hypothetical protein [Actinoplanes sp.]